MTATKKLVLGAREKIRFPELSTSKFLARIDTGAKTSSVHCDQYWFEREKGRKILYAKLLGIHHTFRFEQYGIRTVKSSNGLSQKRFVINLQMQLGTELYDTEFTLTNREKMKNPVLLGRRFLRHGFLVDVSRTYTTSKRKKTRSS